MKTLASFDFGTSDRGTYDWNSLLDGRIHVLEKGVDFTAKASSVKMAARGKAKKRGLKLRTGMEGDNIVLQAYRETKTDTDNKTEGEPKVEAPKVTSRRRRANS